MHNRRRVICAIALLPVFGVVYLLAFYLRFDGQISGARFSQWLAALPMVLLIKVVAFGVFRVYQGWSRFVTFHDLVVLGKAATLSALCLIVAEYLFLPSSSTPRSVLLLDWGLTILMVGGIRAVLRLVDERTAGFSGSDPNARVLIVGANNGGEALLRAIRLSSKLSYHVVGFTTDRLDLVGTSIGGVPVLGTLVDTCRVAADRDVKEVLVPTGELPGRDVRLLVQEAAEHGVRVRIVPSYEQLLSGKIDLRPRTVSIEDLLHRDEVQLDLPELHRWIDNRVLLITGSAGSIGSEICRQLLRFSPRKLVLVDRWENGQFELELELRGLNPQVEVDVCIGDVSDLLRMNCLFQRHRPEIVFHAAAYKHVPLMEANPGEGVKNITGATRMLADLAHRHRATSFVMISTDKAVNPTSVMGACKRVAELYVQSLARQSPCRFVTVRFGNVLDSAGSVVPLFRKQIARGGPVTITHPEMRRFFMTIPEAAQLVIQAGAMGRGGEIFVLNMGSQVKIVDLAADMIQLSGLTVGEDIDIEVTGMRPGEKLYEELTAEGEQHLATSHTKILVAQSTAGDCQQVGPAIDRLARIADGPAEATLVELRRIVPEYQSPDAATARYRDAA